MSRRDRYRIPQAKRYETINGIIGSLWEVGVPVLLWWLLELAVWIKCALIVVWLTDVGPYGYRLLPRIINPVLDAIVDLFSRDED